MDTQQEQTVIQKQDEVKAHVSRVKARLEQKNTQDKKSYRAHTREQTIHYLDMLLSGKNKKGELLSQEDHQKAIKRFQQVVNLEIAQFAKRGNIQSSSEQVSYLRAIIENANLLRLPQDVLEKLAAYKPGETNIIEEIEKEEKQASPVVLYNDESYMHSKNDIHGSATELVPSFILKEDPYDGKNQQFYNQVTAENESIESVQKNYAKKSSEVLKLTKDNKIAQDLLPSIIIDCLYMLKVGRKHRNLIGIKSEEFISFVVADHIAKALQSSEANTVAMRHELFFLIVTKLLPKQLRIKNIFHIQRSYQTDRIKREESAYYYSYLETYTKYPRHNDPHTKQFTLQDFCSPPSTLPLERRFLLFRKQGGFSEATMPPPISAGIQNYQKNAAVSLRNLANEKIEDLKYFANDIGHSLRISIKTARNRYRENKMQMLEKVSTQIPKIQPIDTTGQARKAKIKPIDRDPYYDKAEQLQRRNISDEIPDIYVSLFRIDPNDIELGLDAANALRKNSRKEEALAIYDHLMTLKEDTLDYCLVLSNRANLLQELGKNTEALQAYELAIQEGERIDIVDAVDYKSKAVVEYTLGRYDEAVESYSRFVQLNKTSTSLKRVDILSHLNRMVHYQVAQPITEELHTQQENTDSFEKLADAPTLESIAKGQKIEE